MGKNAYPNESGLPKSTKNKILLWVGSTLIWAILLAVMGCRTEEIIAGAVVVAAGVGVITLISIIDDTVTKKRKKSR